LPPTFILDLRFNFTSDSANNDWGFLFYASASWGPHALNFPHPPGIGGRIWDDLGEKALVTRFKQWEDAPREEQARVRAMMASLVCGLSDTVVTRCELRKDAILCAKWALGVLVQSAINSSDAAAAAAAAADVRRRARLEAASLMVSSCRRVRDSFTHRQKITVLPFVPPGCKRLSVAVQVDCSCACARFTNSELSQESKLSFVFLRHVFDAGVNDDFMSNATIKWLLEKNFVIEDAIRLLSAAENYNKAHAAADAAADALERSIRILEAASQTLRRLTINDVLEIRGMTTPSLGVRLLMQCVCIVLRVKPLVKLDALRQPIYDFWEPAKQQLLVDPKVFLERLWTAMGQDIDDSIVQQVEDCLEKPDMSLDRLKRITKSSVSDVSEWLRALCLHHRAKVAASRESLFYSASESASKRMYVVPEVPGTPAPPDEDMPFTLTTTKGKVAVIPAVGCGILVVLAYGPRANVSTKDAQFATGQVLAKVESVIAAMVRENVLQQDKVVNGFATFSISTGVSFDAAAAARHCKTYGLFKTDLSYALQVRSLASLSVSMFEKKPTVQKEQKPGAARRK
jgi:hypothetical protein